MQLNYGQICQNWIQILNSPDLTDELSTVCERGASISVEELLRRRRDGVAVAVQHGHRAGAAAEHIQEAAVAVGDQVGTKSL